MEQLRGEEERLEEEQDKYHDLLFVDVVDVYRNVPHKLIKFHRWAVDKTSFDFLLKTDDDCYLDLETILDRLKNWSATSPIWWEDTATMGCGARGQVGQAQLHGTSLPQLRLRLRECY